MRRTTVLLCLCLGILLPFPTAFAWNDSGHMIVAQLAWRALSSGERTKISALLTNHPHYAELLNTNIPPGVDAKEWIFMKAATWSDMVRPGAGKPAHITSYHRDVWHYINLPFVAAADAGNAQPSPPKVTNVVEHLEQIETDLKSSAVAANTRAVALCWYLHLMGDLHQPLHAVAWFSPTFNGPTGDQGGNQVAVQPKTAPVKLHTFWDGLLGTGESYAFVDLVADDIKATWPSSKLQKEWKHKTYMEWAEESLEAAVAFAYLDGKVRHAKWHNGITAAEVPDLDTGYEGNAQMIAKRRAAAAGVRLGKKLKAIF